MFALSWYVILISKMYSLLSSSNEIKNRQKKKKKTRNICKTCFCGTHTMNSLHPSNFYVFIILFYFFRHISFGRKLSML